jgi:hypothetical protein
MKFLVKITDKNLGLSVISLDWYENQCSIHLSNTSAYWESELPKYSLGRELQEIYSSKYLPASIRKYIQTSTMILPKFYVIPKVHKTPWSSRPIIPSHSWIISRVAEVIDYVLQPELAKFPSILSSTTDLIKGLQKVESLENCLIVTGDVTAMYTNIDPWKAIEAIKSIISRDTQKMRKSDLTKMLEFVLLNNFFKYRGKIYHQQSGLAMGVACAPIIANLFCGVYEKSRFRYKDQRIPFYGRYIDDICQIFRGTEDELKRWLADWKLPGLNITWEYSRTSAHFLDVEISIEDNRLVTRVYNKMLNKHMYIPFSSAHPLSVKRGFVKAERMRYYTICSQENDAKACEYKLYVNLLKRGYPQKLLCEWFADDLKKVVRPIPKLILPSEYNPI